MAVPKTYHGNGLAVTISDPENITKDECLQLVRAGTEAWNAWRREFPSRYAFNGVWGNSIDFSAVDFTGVTFDFVGFDFGGGANFCNCKFADRVSFSGSRFGPHAQLDGINFEGFAYFNLAQFGDGASFESTYFRTGVSFRECIFGAHTNLSGVQIGGVARFDCAVFGQNARFSGAQFEGESHFAGAEFGAFALFDATQFGVTTSFQCVDFRGSVSFSGKDWAFLRLCYGASFGERRDRAVNLGLSPARLGGVSFVGASFAGPVDFSGREFREAVRFSTVVDDVIFSRPYCARPHELASEGEQGLGFLPFKALKGSPTRFAFAPLFHDCDLHQDISFDGAIFPVATGSDEGARAYRTLKLAFSKQQAVREEQRFFKLEMQEEAARESGTKRWLFRAYEFFSDFGFSVLQPFARLVALPAIGFALAFLLLVEPFHPDLMNAKLIDKPLLINQWLQFTFANLLPLPDSSLIKDLRSTLFGPAGTWVSLAAFVLESLQKLLALIAYFLMGLALRNLFKMK